MQNSGVRRLTCRRIGLVVIAMAITPAARAVHASETVVRIYPTATVNADQVMLSDVAQLTGEGAQLAATWSLTAAPAPGQHAAIDLDSVQKALIRKGINPSTWVFRGASRCRISRPVQIRGTTETITEQVLTPATCPRLASGAANRPVTTAPAEAAASPAPSGPDPDTLEGAIHQHIAGRLAKYGGRPAIQVSPSLRDLLHLSRPAYDFTITDASDRLLGLVPLQVTILREGKVEQDRSILTEVSLVKPVVVATGPINRGQTIQSNDITLRDQTFDRSERIGASDLNAFVGQRAVRFINNDEMVTAKDVESVPLIVRNDLVSVTMRRGAVTIKGVAKALSSAGYGQSVELRNEASKQSFLAVVTGPKTAEMAQPRPVQAETSDSLALAGGNE
jgi:flagella basal body P-ring formation protein FlgA